MKKDNNKISREILNLERSLNHLNDLVVNEFIFSSNNEAAKYYFAKQLIESMIDIKNKIVKKASQQKSCH